MILKLGLADERELTELDRSVRAHFADPRTLTMPHLLFVVRGRQPAARATGMRQGEQQT